MKNLRQNTVWSTAEFVSVVFIQFFIMRYIVTNLGVGKLGVWAVLMSAAQLAGFFDFGVSGGIGRFLARAQTDGNTSNVEKILATIINLTIPLYLTLGLLFYFVLREGLPLILNVDSLSEGRGLLVYAIASYAMQIISGTFSSSLTGLHLGFRKSQICITGIMIQAIMSIFLIGRYGLPGLACAQIANYVFVILMALFVLKASAGVRLSRLLLGDIDTMKKIVRFGSGLQLSSIGWGAFEASIRFMMSRFGGVEMVGYYEIAYRISSQARVLAFYISQPLGPALVVLAAEGQDKLLALYNKIYARFSLYAFVSVIGIALMSPLISLIMIGRVEPTFICFSVLTALGTMAHITAIPSEIAAVAVGRLRYNICGTFSALAIIICGGIIAGTLFRGGGIAVTVLVASYVAASIPIYFNSQNLGFSIVPNWRRDLYLQDFLPKKFGKKHGGY